MLLGIVVGRYVSNERHEQVLAIMFAFPHEKTKITWIMFGFCSVSRELRLGMSPIAVYPICTSSSLGVNKVLAMVYCLVSIALWQLWDLVIAPPTITPDYTAWSNPSLNDCLKCISCSVFHGYHKYFLFVFSFSTPKHPPPTTRWPTLYFLLAPFDSSISTTMSLPPICSLLFIIDVSHASLQNEAKSTSVLLLVLSSWLIRSCEYPLTHKLKNWIISSSVKLDLEKMFLSWYWCYARVCSVLFACSTIDAGQTLFHHESNSLQNHVSGIVWMAELNPSWFKQYFIQIICM